MTTKLGTRASVPIGGWLMAGVVLVSVLLGIPGCGEGVRFGEIGAEETPVTGALASNGPRSLKSAYRDRHSAKLRRCAAGGQTGTGGAPAADGGSGGTDGPGGADGGSSDAAGTFQPCPAVGPCIIMPLGDSITDGNGVPGGYRIELFRQALTDTKLINYVGRNSNGPDTVTVAGQTKTFPKNHEGYLGYTIDNVSAPTDAALVMFKPHIVLLMIGTNDVRNVVDLANAPTRLGNLLDKITTDSPNALLVIAKITPTTTDTTNTRIQTYNNAIPGLVEARVAAGKHILMVDMYAAFTANASYKTLLMDGDVHPNTGGYSVMAETWYSAIQSYLP